MDTLTSEDPSILHRLLLIISIGIIIAEVVILSIIAIGVVNLCESPNEFFFFQ